MAIKKKVKKIYANLVAARGKTKLERQLIRRRIMGSPDDDDVVVARHLEKDINKIIQQQNFPQELLRSEKLIVMLVPEHNTMSGGIFSFFSIVEQLRRLQRHHGYDVVTMTRPNPEGETYFRNNNFRNSENVFRFSQIKLCKHVKELYIMLPEYAVAHFCDVLTLSEKAYLGGRKVFINILNQNINLMPDPAHVNDLRRIALDVTQSVAHHAYFSQEMADKYGVPTLLLPAYTDLSSFPKCGFEEKENIIIYSPDAAPYKQACLDRVSADFPDYELIEIKGISFDKFMSLATRCRFAITFGEGFDGYLAQPILQGGIAFAVYNDDFFPGKHFQEYKNIFLTPDEMINNISSVITALISDPHLYRGLNESFSAEYDKLYSLNDYRSRVKMLALRQFEILPRQVAS